jgi:hypothetical protein
LLVKKTFLQVYIRKNPEIWGIFCCTLPGKLLRL